MRQWIYSAPLLVAALTAGPGCSGELGDASENGVQGPAGPAGPAGPRGATGATGPGAGATGATGATGPAGATGATGPAGADGADGAPGTPGTNGKDGVDGVDGINGMNGATGPSGFLKVLGFDASNIAPNLAANTGTIPVVCRTQPHTAGQKEVAIIHMDGSVLPTVAANAVVYLSVVKAEGAGGFTEISQQSVESMNDGVASTSVTKSFDLVENVSYTFGARFESSSAVNLVKSSCHGTVTIAKKP
jgi:hypothetical protein